MICEYLGNNKTKYTLKSGKVVILTDEELAEIKSFEKDDKLQKETL